MALYYDLADRPKLKQLIAFAFQQMLAIMAATIAVPMIVGIGGLELTIGAVTLTEIATALILGILANGMLSAKSKVKEA